MAGVSGIIALVSPCSFPLYCYSLPINCRCNCNAVVYEFTFNIGWNHLHQQYAKTIHKIIISENITSAPPCSNKLLHTIIWRTSAMTHWKHCLWFHHQQFQKPCQMASSHNGFWPKNYVEFGIILMVFCEYMNKWINLRTSKISSQISLRIFFSFFEVRILHSKSMILSKKKSNGHGPQRPTSRLRIFTMNDYTYYNCGVLVDHLADSDH